MGLRSAAGLNRSIPACAGEPPLRHQPTHQQRVYPRVCGGTLWGKSNWIGSEGLSPRVRGNLLYWAGAVPGSEVYPRVCGGTPAGGCGGNRTGGLSPRVRGNPERELAPPQVLRSIPACAGEPPTPPLRQYTAPVYPRVCGGTLNPVNPRAPNPGLSPRVRGNPHCQSDARENPGSIPACAGEPLHRPGFSDWREVYPRVCGGTFGSHICEIHAAGLSPRVRGNLRQPYLRNPRRGSIPACAGEPSGRDHRVVLGEVYPRVCGGTAPCEPSVGVGKGLSPRVRGNRHRVYHQVTVQGSIPACAGGTSAPSAKKDGGRGLSPRVRGNPHGSWWATILRSVYPRVCGGTRTGAVGHRRRGRSIPRVCGGTPATACGKIWL